ncbi:hypothetical protein GCM10010405_03970 [Streptomyces macrosporus]|uniref:Uncharacterized protein n=1 Tax=Streptomyces macrosporus TaxID=44032 RepID=A0ABN3J8Z0_9ACTN
MRPGAPTARAESAPATAAAGTFTDPVVDRNGADPTIVRYNGHYHHLGTTWASHREMRRSPTVGGLRTATPTAVHRETVASRCRNFRAPELHRLDGPNGPRWYPTYSAGVSGNIDHQHVHVLESAGSDPLAPGAWREFPDPVFRRDAAAGVYGPGHNFFFPSPDGKEVRMAHHAHSGPSDGCGGTRTTRVQKVNRNADGTPDLGTPVSTSTVLREPSGTPALAGRE